jgi:microsomal dipeptidase-like Zn-dependent dipeptidase
MDRRVFLKIGSLGGMAWMLAKINPVLSNLFAQEEGAFLKNLPIWDAHAHPYSFFSDRPDPTTPTIPMMKEVGVAVCVFAAVGDSVFNVRSQSRGIGAKFDTAKQLDRLKGWAKSGAIKIIKNTADLDRLRPDDLGAIVGIEGGDALEGRIENLDYFYEEYGVRLITLMHDNNNAIGRHQRANPDEEGLTRFGRNVVERMNRIGMIIDVAHAQTNTLRDITELSKKPVVDSHTSISEGNIPLSRLRSWEEMEWVAKNGGVVCTWPFAFAKRSTLADWAKEITVMKSKLGGAFIGLGTDGGGRLPQTVEGYKNIGDLSKLVKTMREAGLDQADIRAYLGGNFERVVRASLSKNNGT